MQTKRIHRSDLPGFLKSRTDRRPDGKPLFPIFSVYSHRRTPLELRYPPVDDFTNGPLCRVGDHSLMTDRGEGIIRDAKGRSFDLEGAGPKAPIVRRRGEKIEIEGIGAGRWQVIKNWAKDEDLKATKHHQPKGGSLHFNPADHDLFMVRGMYNDAEKNGRIGRYGSWRPFAMLCMRSITTIRCDKTEFHVIEAPIIPTAPVAKTTRAKLKVA